MAKDSIDDFLNQMNAGGGNSVRATNNDMPVIKIKPVNEDQIPEIKTKIQKYGLHDNESANSNKNQ